MNPTQRLAAEYSRTAGAYAEHWAAVIHPLAMQLMRELPLASAGRLLDLGTGTGASLADLAAAAPQARILGVDRSEGMLRIAQGVAQGPLALMDAQHLGLRPATVDVALLVLVLFHMPDPPAVLLEVRRVLRAGGSIGLVTWGRDPGLPGLSIWIEELDAQGAGPDPRDPSVVQHARMDTPEKLAGLLEAAGFSSVESWRNDFEHRWTVAGLLALQSGCGMPSRRLTSLPEAQRIACRSRVEARLARLAAEQLVYRSEAVFAVAR